MNSLLCYTCDTILKDNTPFYLFQCNCCKQKTSYCLLCQKVLGKLFSGLLFKCAQCNTINRTETMELVAKQDNCNQQCMNSTFFDNQKIFASSLLQNDSCIKDLFGNSFNQSVNNIDFNITQPNQNVSIVNGNALFNTQAQSQAQSQTQINSNIYSYFTPRNRSIVNTYSNSEKKDFNYMLDDFSNKLYLETKKHQDLTEVKRDLNKNPFIFHNDKTIKQFNGSEGTINKTIINTSGCVRSKLGKMIAISLRDTQTSRMVNQKENEMTRKMAAMKSDFEGYNKQETISKETEEALKLNPFKIPPKIMEQSKYAVTMKQSNTINEEPMLSTSSISINNSCKMTDIKPFNAFDFSDVTDNLSKRFTRIKLPNPEKENVEVFYSNNLIKEDNQNQKDNGVNNGENVTV